MNRQMSDQEIKGNAGAPPCAHADELITYLYGETTEDEARTFRQHLGACASCQEELGAFGYVREAIGAWRTEALAITPLLAADHEVAARQANIKPARSMRSALTALRDFFVLAPSWLQAGAVATSVLIGALAALLVINAEIRWDQDGIAFSVGDRTRVVTQTIEAPVERGPSPEEVEAMVAARVARELDALRDRTDDSPITTASLPASRKDASARRIAIPSSEMGLRRAQRSGSNSSARTEQLAIRDDRDEDELPRLYDLLSEVN